MIRKLLLLIPVLALTVLALLGATSAQASVPGPSKGVEPAVLAPSNHVTQAHLLPVIKPKPYVRPAPPPPPPAPVVQPASSGISIPGMPQGLANCIWERESTDGTNPAANGNQFGIIPASGYNVAGYSIAQQEQVAGQIYAQSGGVAWSADGCPGT